MKNVIQVEGLTVSYANYQVLDDVHFTVEQGRLVGIIGPNGAGKSTLLKAMLNLIPYESGKVRFANRTIKQIRKQIAYVPQRSMIDLDFPIEVFDTVLLGRYPTLGLFKRPRQNDKEIAYESLKTVGMENYAKKQIGELSGGQQQRVFLARALAMNADFYFLDEPFIGVDVASEKIMIKLLKQLRDQGKFVFIVHHDLSKIKDYFDELIIVNNKQAEVVTVNENVDFDLIQNLYDTQYRLAEA